MVWQGRTGDRSPYADFKKIAACAAIFLLHPKSQTDRTNGLLREKPPSQTVPEAVCQLAPGPGASPQRAGTAPKWISAKRNGLRQDGLNNGSRRRITQVSRSPDQCCRVESRFAVALPHFPLRPIGWTPRNPRGSDGRTSSADIAPKHAPKPFCHAPRFPPRPATLHGLRYFLPAAPPVLFPLRGPGEEQNRPVTAEQEKNKC